MIKSIAAAALVLLASSARANLTDWSWLTQYQKPNMHYGQFALHPYYKFSEIYDSNIFLVPHDLQDGSQVGGGVRGSWITRNNLGLETNLPFAHINNLSLGYDFTSDIYSTDPALNDTINQSAHVDFVRSGPQGLTYKIGDQYANTTDQAFSELIQRKRRWMNIAYAELDYRPTKGRLAGGADVSHETDKYIDPAFAALLNRFEDRAGFNVGYMVQPKTKAYIAYHRGIIHYGVPPASGNPDKDSRSHTVSAGVDGALAPKAEGQVEAGMTYREYDAAAVAGAPRVNRSPMVAASVTYKPDPYSKMILTASRILQESIDPSNPFYYSSSVTLDADHKFPRKFTAGLSLSYAVDAYLNAQTSGTTTGNRRDDLYQGGLWVEYDIQQWLSTGLSYVYRERDSTLSGQFNYQDSQTAWNVALKF